LVVVDWIVAGVVASGGWKKQLLVVECWQGLHEGVLGLPFQ
jgi:hypothetical protein